MEVGIRTLDRYIIEAPIAETRLSRVWLARDAHENRRVALKTIRRFPDNEDLVEAARFGAELQRMLCGQDRRVVKVYRYGEAEGYLFIDMEFIEGKDVSQIIAEQGRIAPDLAVRVALEVAEMLDNLHNFSTVIDGNAVVSAVHGDLKPKNIRIGGDWNGNFAVKVLDFGTAKALSQSKPGGTRIPAWSPPYASPELLDRREMNPLSDRWALGVTLYEMVTGRVPFGAGKGIEEIENQIRRRPTMPDLGVPDCPAALHTILFKLLHPEPERRYQSARELCLDLRAYPEVPKVSGYQGETVRSDLPPASAGATTRRSPVPEQPQAAPRPKPFAPARAPVPRSPRWLLTRAGFVLAFAAFSMWLFVREVRAWHAASDLRAGLVAEKIDPAEARNRLKQLQAMWFVWLPTGDIARTLNAGLIAAGDEIVTRFRTAPLRNAEWQQARSYFEAALESDSRNDSIRGRVRICDAQMKRFQAQAEKNPDLVPAAQERFEEAAKLLPRSPDPWLGLAMLALYNLKDPVKGEQVLEEARNRGFDFTAESRWVSLLADGYRQRADALDWEAQRIARTLPDEAIDRNNRAIAYHEKAIAWYAKIPLYGRSLAYIARCRASVERLKARVETLRAVQAGPA